MVTLTTVHKAPASQGKNRHTCDYLRLYSNCDDQLYLSTKKASHGLCCDIHRPALTILWKRVFGNKQKPQTLYVCVMRDMTKSYPKWQSCAVHAVKTQRD
jgi:hypothetical protein